MLASFPGISGALHLGHFHRFPKYPAARQFPKHLMPFEYILDAQIIQMEIAESGIRLCP
jgi:hypothetical protein